MRVKQDDEPWWERLMKVKHDDDKPELEYLSGPGDHLIEFKGRSIWASFDEGE